MSEARDRLRRLAGLAPLDPEAALGSRPKPRGWNAMSRVERLDHIADRILAEDRSASGVTAHQALKETGILSVWQLDRRRRREIMSPAISMSDEYADMVHKAHGDASLRKTARVAGTARSYPRQYQHDFVGYTPDVPQGPVTIRRIAPVIPEG